MQSADKKIPEHIPGELLSKFDEMPEFKSAYKSLTPGRQRGYILHFSQPKQSKTRFYRTKKYIPTIIEVKGTHDAYRASRNKKDK